MPNAVSDVMLNFRVNANGRFRCLYIYIKTVMYTS